MKSFDEVKEIKIDESDRNALVVLKHSRGWARLQRIVEDYVLKLTHNLAAGNAVSKEARYEEMDKVAGFVYFWKKIIELIENSEHKDEEIEP